VQHKGDYIVSLGEPLPQHLLTLWFQLHHNNTTHQLAMVNLHMHAACSIVTKLMSHCICMPHAALSQS